MLQTLFQSTRLAQHEYINAFGTDGWRETVSTSVTANHDYLYPPDPNDPDPEDGPDDESEDESHAESEDESEDVSENVPAPQQPTRTPPPQPPPDMRRSPADTEAALAAARTIFPDRSNSAPPQAASPTPNPVIHTPQPTPIPNPTNPTPPPATLSGPRSLPLPRRRHHDTSTNSFVTNIYTRPGNY